MRSKGKIASWNDEKGYGFIAPFDDGAQVFIHIKALANRDRRPQVNDVVTYAIARDKQGRVRAADATLAGDKLPERKKRRRGLPSI
ncbi:MAG: cold shock domain-containing protein, partial [Gammaproteobacteria bacterium]